MHSNDWEETLGTAVPDEKAAAVLEAMRRRPREDFLPTMRQHEARYDRPVDIGYGQTNSQPSTVANMLWLLDVQPGQTVLDLGAGSGWSTAILGDLVGESGSVLGLEIVPELVEAAQKVLERQNMSWIGMQLATDQTLGSPQHAPFDRILVSAEATDLPAELVEQLGPQGIMVIPVAGQMLRVLRQSENPDDVEISQHGAYRFVALRSS